MRGRPRRTLLVLAAAALLVAAAIGVNVVLLGYANNEHGPAGGVSPGTRLTTTSSTPAETTPTGDDGAREVERDD
jgi:hypothetical protein